MARRRKNRNKGRYNNRKGNVNNFQSFQKSRQNQGRTQAHNKLYLNPNLEEILKRITDKGSDPIAERLLSDSKQDSVPIRISWLNITKSGDYLSFTTPDRVKQPKDAWIQKNRTPAQIRNVIRKMYKKTFSNNQIKNFGSKFKSVYSAFTKENRADNKKIKADTKILDNIIAETENGELLWKRIDGNEYYSKYQTKIFITDKKYVLIDIYEVKDNENDFITFNLVDETKKGKDTKKFMKTINDPDAVWMIKSYIENA